MVERYLPARSAALSLVFLALVVSPPSAAAPDGGTDPLIDLTTATVVAPPELAGPARKAVSMLVEEVERRSGLTWDTAGSVKERRGPLILVGSRATVEHLKGAGPRFTSVEPPHEPEGFRIAVDPAGPTVLVAGSDPRGVVYGVGRLLRELRIARGQVRLPAALALTTWPRVRLRGHQLGYRPKTNSYDGWDLPQWEQYIRDLAVFGANAVELVPPRTDDDEASPHFPRPPLEMMVGMSKLLDDYGLDVWLWYPAMDADYAKPETVDSALEEWGAVFRKLPRVDAVFVPGGDPGHTRPAVLMPLLERAARVLRRHHPKAELWVSPQAFNAEWLDEFLRLMKAEPQWLTGIVHGPQVRIGVAALRAAIPRRYPIRVYPDITHSLQCQYPVPEWDLAYARTEGREVINPRPIGQQTIFRHGLAHSLGFLTYSEGCNDDVNKAIWSGLGWDPDADVVDLLRQYSRYFLGEHYTEPFAQGLLALERNWQGPLLTNRGVETTLLQFQDMERAAEPRDRLNWRFQQALYRAYYDAYTRDRLIHETALEERAYHQLREAPRVGSLVAMRKAEEILDEALLRPVSIDRKARVESLAEALFQSIRMQLSVTRYQAIDVDRGANLDTIDVPLNDRVWLLGQFGKLRAIRDEKARQQGLDAILGRTDPGPGGFYDDLGDPSRQPHLVRGPGFERDPAFLNSSLVGFGERSGWPLAWCQNAQSLNDAPLCTRYTGLDRRARYRVRVVYSGDKFETTIRLSADGIDIHPLIKKPLPVEPMEFDVPAAATADGELTLTWTQEPGRGGNGRGCEVGEVWLLRAAGHSTPTSRDR
jgi:hypothetical protein